LWKHAKKIHPITGRIRTIVQRILSIAEQPSFFIHRRAIRNAEMLPDAMIPIVLASVFICSIVSANTPDVRFASLRA